ncbi:MAG: putative membrane transporter protein [Succiniclasticum sp.]|jgi:uncharacterized protein
MDSFTSYLIVIPLLFLAGFVDSIAGGGGLISLPAYFLAGLPAHLALGTNKFSSTCGTTISTIRFAMNGFIRPRLALICIVGAVTGSSIGSRLALLVSEEVISKLMLVALPIVAFYVMRNKKLTQKPGETEPEPDRSVPWKCAVTSLFIGAYDGFYGPGTGTFLLLVLTGWCKLGLRTAAGLTKASNLSSNVAALATFLLTGNVYFPLALAGAVANICGNYVGSGMVLKDAGRVVKPIIILVLVLLFIKVLWQG